LNRDIPQEDNHFFSLLCAASSRRDVCCARKKKLSNIIVRRDQNKFQLDNNGPTAPMRALPNRALCKKQNRFSVIYTREASLVFYLKQTPQILSVQQRAETRSRVIMSARRALSFCAHRPGP
jgi:hypothetical protein